LSYRFYYSSDKIYAFPGTVSISYKKVSFNITVSSFALAEIRGFFICKIL
jgi:hypothetical protein